MQGAVRQIAVYRSGNIHCRKVKIVSAAGGKGELFVDPLFNRQRNIRETACKVGFAVAVVLLVEDLQGIGTLGKAGRNGKLCRTVFFCEGGVAAAVIDYITDIIKDQSGNIFVCAGFCVGIGYLYGAALGGSGNLPGSSAEIVALAVIKGQLPFVSGVIWGNGLQPSVGLAAHGGGCKEDRVQIQVESGTNAKLLGSRVSTIVADFTSTSHKGSGIVFVWGAQPPIA